MPSSVASLSSVASPRLDLATRLMGNSQAPEQAIKAIFDELVLRIAEHAATPIGDDLKSRIWRRVSPQKIAEARSFFISEYCRIVLAPFSDRHVNSMLAEHLRTGAVSGELHFTLNVVSSIRRSILMQSLSQRASSIAADWVLQIIETASDKGVEFRDPN